MRCISIGFGGSLDERNYKKRNMKKKLNNNNKNKMINKNNNNNVSNSARGCQNNSIEDK